MIILEYRRVILDLRDMKTSEEYIPPPDDSPSHPPPESPEFSYATEEMGEIFNEWGDEQNKRRCSSPKSSHNNHDDSITEDQKQAPRKSRRNDGPNQAEELIQLCEANVSEFFIDQFGQPYAQLDILGHSELWLVSSRRFSAWLARLYRQNHGKPPTDQAFKQAQRQIEAICFEKPKQTLHNRVARLNDKILHDLTNESWQCVEITKDGYRIISQPSIFRRFKHQTPQQLPSDDGSINELWDFVNVPKDKRNVLAVLIATWFIPDISHPILVLHGEPGTGKSTISHLLRQLVDPSILQSLAAPKNSEEAYQTFDHNWLVPLDNLSKIPSGLSDTLCRVVTGEGSTKRKLYSDDDDFIRSYRRCVILNGIGNPANQADLLDRSIVIELDPIESIRTESSMMEAWNKAKPHILGSIFNALSIAMKLYPSISETNLPRMADFAMWGQAVAMGLGFKPEQFLSDYLATIEQKWSDKIEDSPLALEILTLADNNEGFWEGSRSELCLEIKLEENKNKAYWPKSPQGVSRELTKLMPALRKSGMIIERGKISGGKRVMRVYREIESDTEELPF